MKLDDSALITEVNNVKDLRVIQKLDDSALITEVNNVQT